MKKILMLSALTIESLILIFIVFPLTVRFFYPETQAESIELFNESSPSGDYQLRLVRRLALNPFEKGAIEVILYKNDPEVIIKSDIRFRVKLSDIQPTGDFHVEWLDDCVQITLFQDEAREARYILPFFNYRLEPSPTDIH